MTLEFACDMSALSGEKRDRHGALVRSLLDRIAEFSERSNGYAVRLPSDEKTILAAAEFIALERLCCPFFDLGMRVEANGGPLWIDVTGPEGIKPFIRAEFGFA